MPTSRKKTPKKKPLEVDWSVPILHQPAFKIIPCLYPECDMRWSGPTEVDNYTCPEHEKKKADWVLTVDVVGCLPKPDILTAKTPYKSHWRLEPIPVKG